MDLHSTRLNMVEQQIRTWDVLDERVLSLYRSLWREEFVADEGLRDLAYTDMRLPIGDGQVMLEPKLEARMVQLLAPAANEDILHIGAGSGYFAALLGKLARTVATVEINADIAAAAKRRLAPLDNVTVHIGDGARGVDDNRQYDAVVLTGSVPVVADAFFDSLRIGGRLLAATGQAPAMTLRLMEKRGDGVLLIQDILETDIPPLINAPGNAGFSF